jgi:hypothetical protein
MGTGLFFALLPTALREACQLTGVGWNEQTGGEQQRNERGNGETRR